MQVGLEPPSGERKQACRLGVTRNVPRPERRSWEPDPPDVDEAERAMLAVAAREVDETWLADWLRERRSPRVIGHDSRERRARRSLYSKASSGHSCSRLVATRPLRLDPALLEAVNRAREAFSVTGELEPTPGPYRSTLDEQERAVARIR